jgi:hypothetical protein
MSSRPYEWVSATFFSLVAILQLTRAVGQFPAQIGDTQVPVWLSWIAALVAGSLAAWGFRVAARR